MTGWPPRRFAINRSVTVLNGGRTLLGGAPPRMTTLTAAGAELLAQSVTGARRERSRGECALLARLTRANLLDPMPDRDEEAWRRTTVVIPARDESARIGEVVERARSSAARVIVVDDGSLDETAQIAARAGAEVIRHRSSEGPGAARNTGVEATTTELIAFLDADCLPEADWINSLAPHLEAPGCGLVAPRIRGAAPRASGERLVTRWLSRHETDFCPLDMGEERGIVGPGRPTGFLPSAAIVARTEILREAGGFDRSLRHGEDVDLVWRLADAGIDCRYEPAVVVRHHARGDLAGFMRQRWGYGGSAAALDRSHPRRVAPWRGRPASLAAALSVPWLGPFGPLAAAVAGGFRLRRSVPSLPLRQAAAMSLAAQSNAGATLSRSLSREWLPLTVLGLASSRTRRIALLAGAALIVDQARGQPWRRAPISVGLGALDRVSYAAGLWAACLRDRRLAALRPDLVGPAGDGPASTAGRQVTHPAQGDHGHEAVG